MKYILSLFGVGIIACAIFLCGGINTKNQTEQDYLRIHITANSNSTEDQNVKYKVKDAVVEFLIPLLSQAQTKSVATEIVLQNKNLIAEIANSILKSEGFRYGANVLVAEENVPTRSYDALTLESGVYECLKIDLGEAKGDNWWCVVFPAVCFINSKNPENYVYISKIWEIINNVTQKGEI